MEKGRRICVDIDGVLCEETGGHDDYAEREPLARGLDLVRKLKADGYYVILHTARWEEDRQVTADWMERHKVDYDELVLGKPSAAIYIDDRALQWPVNPGTLWRRLHADALEVARTIQPSPSTYNRLFGRNVCPHCNRTHDPHLMCMEVD